MTFVTSYARSVSTSVIIATTGSELVECRITVFKFIGFSRSTKNRFGSLSASVCRRHRHLDRMFIFHNLKLYIYKTVREIPAMRRRRRVTVYLVSFIRLNRKKLLFPSIELIASLTAWSFEKKKTRRINIVLRSYSICSRLSNRFSTIHSCRSNKTKIIIAIVRRNRYKSSYTPGESTGLLIGERMNKTIFLLLTKVKFKKKKKRTNAFERKNRRPARKAYLPAAYWKRW